MRVTFHNKSFFDLFNRSINIKFCAINPLHTNDFPMLCFFEKLPGHTLPNNCKLLFYYIFPLGITNDYIKSRRLQNGNIASGICQSTTLFLSHIDHHCSPMNLLDCLSASSCPINYSPYKNIHLYLP